MGSSGAKLVYLDHLHSVKPSVSFAHRLHNGRKRPLPKLLEKGVMFVEAIGWRTSGKMAIDVT